VTLSFISLKNYNCHTGLSKSLNYVHKIETTPFHLDVFPKLKPATYGALTELVFRIILCTVGSLQLTAFYVLHTSRSVYVQYGNVIRGPQI
jgi:hypothetical protein